jgi:hypothetical protein
MAPPLDLGSAVVQIQLCLRLLTFRSHHPEWRKNHRAREPWSKDVIPHEHAFH